MTNRALYDQFVGDDGRANTMLAKFENPNGSFARAARTIPTLYNRFVSVVTSADSLVDRAQRQERHDRQAAARRHALHAHRRTWRVAGDSLMKIVVERQGLAGRLLNDPTLYDQLNKLTTDLGAILEDVRKDPTAVLQGRGLRHSRMLK